MKKSHVLILAGLCAAGLLSGFAARRIFSGSLASGVHVGGGGGEDFQPESSSPANPRSRYQEKSALPEIPLTRSTDTAESILTADPKTEYARIALWLTTASEPDIAAYWAGYKGKERTVPVTELVFLNWTRRHPQAATAAVAGTDDERYAWWSWAANDPDAALEAAKGYHGRVLMVAYGIGDFNPAWLQAHLDQIPEECRSMAFGRMKNWPAGQDPLASLNFLKENRVGFDPNLFKSLVQKDPWSALDWMRANPRATSDPFSQSMLDLLVSTLSRERPEDLERMAAQTPPGEQKRAMEKALFDRLLESDPEAALAQARKLEAPLVAAEWLGQAGLGLLPTQPDRAFEIGGEILRANPRKLDIQQEIDYPGGGSGSSIHTGPATELMDALFAHDRQQTVDLIAAQVAGQTEASEPLHRYVTQWADQDLAGLTDWLGDQQDPIVIQQTKRVVGDQLAEQGNFLESIEWLESADPGTSLNLIPALDAWQRADPEAAIAWLEASKLSDSEKAKYHKYLKNAGR